MLSIFLLIYRFSIISCVIKIFSCYSVSSCSYPPCRYVMYREPDDNGNIIVNDASSHVITWTWEVKGGRWNVTYRYIYPGGWYEGEATFLNCSHLIDGKEQAYISWGSSKAWQSNAVPVWANPWNITYNGDTFGFEPYHNGKYIFKVYSRNKRHNPFTNEGLIVAPGSCHLTSSDSAQIRGFWAERKRQRSCEVVSFEWQWYGNGGRWRVLYQWSSVPEKITSRVFYAQNTQYENMIIEWVLDEREKSVMYKSSGLKIYNEPGWKMNLDANEYWGFSPVGQGNWIFQHFSRNIVFQPFTS